MHTKTHRHFVAVPIALLFMVGIAGLESVLPADAAATVGASEVRFTAKDTATDFQVGWQLAGTLEPGAALKAHRDGMHPELLRGEALLRSSGFTQLSAGPVTVVGFATAYVVIRDASAVTVVPLSGPVIVVHPDTEEVIVPGIQMSVTAEASRAASVPQDWYAERLQALKLLPEAVLPSDAHASLTALVTQGRVTPDAFAQGLASAEKIDPTGSLGRMLLLRLLQENGRTDDDASESIAEAIMNDRFISTSLIRMLPIQIVSLAKPVADAHIEGWERATLSLGLTDASAAIDVIHRNRELPQTLARMGYPRQSILWQKALTSVAGTLRTTLSGDALASVDADLAVLAQGGIEEEVLASTPHVYVPSTHWSESELIAIVRATLQKKGALMGLTTELAPDTPTQTVRVTGIFIAENGVDVPYECVFDVARGLIASIQRDGQRMPNAVPVDTFFR